jgi:hypothetical protein
MKIGKAEITATAYLENPQVICSYQGLFELDKLQNENKKLREALEKYEKIVRCVSGMDVNATGANQLYVNQAREALKEVGE